MNLFHLRYFVTLAHVKHYTKAAESLCIAQPSLSHAIAQLEKEVGLPLFEKNGRKTTLTRFGEEFLACAEHTLSVLDAGVASLRRSACGAGLVRLGLLRTLGIEYLPRLVAEFLKSNPAALIQFSFHTDVTQNLLQGLAAGRFDLAFCSRPAEQFNFTAVQVRKQELVVIVPPEHPLAAQSAVDLAATAPYPQIFFAKSSGLRGVVDGMFAQVGVTPQIAYETEEDQVIAGLAAAGFGIAVVPQMELLRQLPLKILRITNPVYERGLFMVHNDAVFMPPAVGRFRQFVLDDCRKLADETL